jgi:hypothetical protein
MYQNPYSQNLLTQKVTHYNSASPIQLGNLEILSGKVRMSIRVIQVYN